MAQGFPQVPLHSYSCYTHGPLMRMTLRHFNPSRPYLRLPFLIGAIAVVTVSTWIIGWQYVEQALLRLAGEGLALGARDIAVELDRTLFERYGDMRVLSRVLSNRVERDVAYVQAHISTLMATYRIYHWIAVLDRNGRIIASSSPAMIGSSLGQTKWFQETKARAAQGPDAAYVGGVEAFVTDKGARRTLSRFRRPSTTAWVSFKAL